MLPRGKGRVETVKRLPMRAKPGPWRRLMLGPSLCLCLAAASAASLERGQAGAADRPADRHAMPIPVRVEQTSSDYLLDAVSFAELIEQIESRRPDALSRSGSHALTELNLGIQYTLMPGAQSCRLHKPELILRMRQHLPRWQPRETVHSSLSARWDRMLAGLDAHEQGHQALAEESAQRMALQLADLEPASNCRALLHQVERVWMREWTRMELKHAVYDRRTQSGARQGAVLSSAESDRPWRQRRARMHRGD